MMALSRLISLLAVACLCPMAQPILAQQNQLPLKSAEGGVAAFSDIVSEADRLAAQGDYDQALRRIIPGLEEYPGALNREAYDTLRRRTYDWFGKATSTQREALIAELEDGSIPAGDSGTIPLSRLTEWLNLLLPTTTLRTPDALLVAAGWQRQMGNVPRAVTYATLAYLQDPNAPAAERAIPTAMAWQYYGFQPAGMAQTARIAVQAAPDGWAAAWAICRMGVFYTYAGKPDEAERFCQEMQAQASSNTLAGRTASEMILWIHDIRTHAYASALERFWTLHDYLLTDMPGDDVLRALCLDINWLHARTDPAIKARVDQITSFCKLDLATGKDSVRKACVLLILAHCSHSQGDATSAAVFLERMVKHGVPVLEEFGLDRLAGLYFLKNPSRAVECLETRFNRYGATTDGSETAMRTLGMLYRKLGRYDEALLCLQEAQRRCAVGQAAIDVRGPVLTANIAGCLQRLGRSAEAEALAAPLLQGYQPGMALDGLSPQQVGAYLSMLGHMGRTEEADVLAKWMVDRPDRKRP